MASTLQNRFAAVATKLYATPFRLSQSLCALKELSVHLFELQWSPALFFLPAVYGVSKWDPSKSYSGPILFKFSVQRGGVVSNMAWSADESTIFLDKRRNEGFIPGTNQLCKNANISQKNFIFQQKRPKVFSSGCPSLLPKADAKFKAAAEGQHGHLLLQG